ncbi:MAG: tRNA threonylcarbamoyladenosine biosynthesis protein TsaE [Syntrophomonadaceae bacterium]|nr:tRNA threonylcarbamoyladenosine biosynthesis protein TsaE [Bacillota bacterium]
MGVLPIFNGKWMVVARTCSEEQTEALGRAVGERLFPGAVLLLEGALGAGKSVFARGVARALGISGPVRSPTFTILNVLEGRWPFYHFDLYRLDDETALLELGMEEYLDGEGVCAVEWADKFSALSTVPSLSIRIVRVDEHCREIMLAAEGLEYKNVCAALLPKGELTGASAGD